MLDMKELYWAAGFIEGDGSFTFNKGMPRIKVAQIHKPPLKRLLNIFGGKIYRMCRERNIWSWELTGKDAAALAMTLYSIMSPKRKGQIRRALKAWKAGLGKWGYYRNKKYCKKGHRLTLENTYFYPNKFHRACILCRAAGVKRFKDKQGGLSYLR